MLAWGCKAGSEQYQPCLYSRDGCRSHLAHYSIIYLFIYIWMSRFFGSKHWLQAHSQMELNSFLRKTRTRESHFHVVISSWGYLFPVLFFHPFAPSPPLEFGVQKSKKLSNLCCCWFGLHLVLTPKDLRQIAPKSEIHRLVSESSGRLHHGVLVHWGRREICLLSGFVSQLHSPFDSGETADKLCASCKGPVWIH